MIILTTHFTVVTHYTDGTHDHGGDVTYSATGIGKQSAFADARAILAQARADRRTRVSDVMVFAEHADGMAVTLLNLSVSGLRSGTQVEGL